MKNKLIKVSLIILILASLTVSFGFFNQPNNQVLAEGVDDTWNKVWNSSDIGTVSSIAVDDVDGDGTNEIVVGTLNNEDSSVYTYTYHGYVYIFNALTHELEWQSSDIGYVYNVVTSDLDGDGNKEIIALVKYGASAVIGYRYGFVYVFDGLTHEQKWKSQDIGSYGDLAIDDLDGDGIKEIIASGDSYYSCTRYGNVYVFDGASFTQKWKSGNIPRAHEIVVADPDDDGVKEIVIGNSVNDCAGYYPGNVYVFDGVNFIQEWVSGDIGMVYANSLVVDDVDNDGVKEISAGVRRTWYPPQGYIYVFDGKTHVQEWQSPIMDSLLNLKVNDVDNDGTKEIIARTDVNFRVFDGQTHALEWESSNMGYNLDLEVDDVDNDGVIEILTRDTSSGNGILSIFNGLTHEEEWRSQDIGVGGGRKSLIVADIDNDGWKEIVAGGGKELHHGNLYIFALPPENQPPTADAGGSYEGNEGFPINLDGSNSTDTDGSIILYEWDFDGDGIYDASSTSATTTHTWGDDYQGEAALRVTDDEGLANTATSSVIVNNVAPTANAGPDQLVTAGDIVNFNGSMTDPGWLDTHTYEWDFDSSDGIQADAVGQTPSHIYYNAGVYTITLTVTDDDKGVGTDTLIVEVKPIPATIDCDPDTLNLKSEGEWITCYIELPVGYDVRKIDAATILLNGIVPPELDSKYGFVKSEDSYITDHDGDGILERMVKFDRAAVQVILSPGEAVVLTITGKVFYNQGLADFEDSDIIRVIAPGECNNCNPNPSDNGKK